MICHEFPISIWPGPCRWPVVTRFPFCQPSLTRREKLPSAFNPMMQPSVQHGLCTQYCLLLKSPPWSPLPARPWKSGTWVTSTSTSPLSPRRKSRRHRTVFSQAVQTSVKSLPVNPPLTAPHAYKFKLLSPSMSRNKCNFLAVLQAGEILSFLLLQTHLSALPPAFMKPQTSKIIFDICFLYILFLYNYNIVNYSMLNI